MHIPMYGLMVFLGMIAYAIYTCVFVVKKEGYDPINRNRVLFCSVIGFLTLYVFAALFNALFHSIEQGKLVFGGITWLGGVIGAVPLTIFYIHKLVPKDKGNAVNSFSSLLPGLVVAHALGRVGCFFGGCCYGQVTDSIFGVSFPAGSSAGKLYPDLSATAEAIIKEVTNEAGEVVGTTTLYPSLPVMPTQLFEALFELLLFIVMIVFYKKLKKYNIEIYCFAYGLFRFLLEFARGDSRGATGLPLTPSQLMSIVLWIIATLIILYRNDILFKKLKRKAAIWQKQAKEGKGATPLLFKGKASDSTATIRELHALMKDGIISEEEFLEKKKELLKKI